MTETTGRRSWIVDCPACGDSVISNPRGACPRCERVLVAEDPCLPFHALDPVENDPGLAAFRSAVADVVVSDDFPWWLALGFLVAIPYPILFPVLMMLGLLWVAGGPDEDDPESVTDTPGSLPAPLERRITAGERLTVEKLWFSVRRIRGRRGIVTHCSVRTTGMLGRLLEMEVRFRGPGGHYLRSSLRGYSGPAGEVRLAHRTRPLQRDDSRFSDLWIFVPTRALALPPSTRLIRLTAEVVFHAVPDPARSAGQAAPEFLSLQSLAIEFTPIPEDLAVPLVASTAPTPQGPSNEAILFLPPETSQEITCQVCGDPLSGATVRCNRCETPHHQDCWEFHQGCSTYGCEGRPR